MITSSTCPSTNTFAEPRVFNRMTSPSVPQDPQILRAQSGDLDAFNALVMQYQDRVYRQAFWMLGDSSSAEDAAQEVFLLAYRKLSTYNCGSFISWLLRITTNYCLDQIRAAKRRPCQPLTLLDSDGEEIEPSWMVDPGDLPETTVERQQMVAAVARAVQKLSPEFRMVVVLIDMQEMDYAEASAVLHIPTGTLKSRLARARLKLRDELIHSRLN